MNNKLIMIFGIRRSGLHLTANFFAEQFAEPVHILNNQSITQFVQAETSGVDGKLESVNARVIIFEEQPSALIDIPVVHGYFKNLLGTYKEIHRILLLRDLFNLFASRVHHYPEYISVNRTWIKKDFVQKDWLKYAERYLTPEGVIPVSYNKLITDLEYRKSLSKAVNGDTYSEKSLFKVDPNGGGSSFTGTATPNTDRVLTQYRHYSDLKVFQDLFEPEYHKLSKQIFDLDVNFNDEGH